MEWSYIFAVVPNKLVYLLNAKEVMVSLKLIKIEAKKDPMKIVRVGKMWRVLF